MRSTDHLPSIPATTVCIILRGHIISCCMLQDSCHYFVIANVKWLLNFLTSLRDGTSTREDVLKQYLSTKWNVLQNSLLEATA